MSGRGNNNEYDLPFYCIFVGVNLFRYIVDPI